VLVVDAGEPRNAKAPAVHNYLGREGTTPAHLLAAGRDEVAMYGGTVASGQVAAVERREDGTFGVALEDGRRTEARRLLVTTGLVDELPDLPGVAQRWGRDVLHCPYCHGWETRDRAVGVLATGPQSVHQALLWRQLSADVTFFRHTAPALPDAEAEQLAALGIRMVDGEVAGLVVDEDRLTGVRLASGDVVDRDVVVVAPRFTARSGPLSALGLETAELKLNDAVVGTHVPADPMGATTVPGVWVAGNVTALQAQVISSAAAGLNAGAAINADLVAEDTRAVVAAARALVAVN
jgi:thioredoxin reductase (NADPH)